ncbi:hypothetical protein ANCCAN_01924 [Ancylostoma caninum]|uniref:Uncharacterized protein n=1 Tax=Ancylostoma caninum TaxID=29170 RepID=A0A368H5G2_ANCCA|nr:hypothetical protein ANCCAN_01924 [Ancylostoma caninum]
MDAVAYDLFGVSSESSLALWAYGYTNFSKYPATSLANMRRNYNDFKGDLYGFGYVRTNNPLSTKGKNANELPKLELEKLKLEKIIAVGLDNANLDALLPSNGIAVSVPKHFVDSHVNQIVNAIVKKPVPVTTTKPVTTRRPTPTVPTEITPECLIVGDLYNFGDDMEAYEMEANLIDDVAYDLFGNLSPKSKLGLWMYGYTNVTSPGSALSRMRKTYNEFKKDLNDIEYIKVANPLKTKA